MLLIIIFLCFETLKGEHVIFYLVYFCDISDNEDEKVIMEVLIINVIWRFCDLSFRVTQLCILCIYCTYFRLLFMKNITLHFLAFLPKVKMCEPKSFKLYINTCITLSDLFII